MKKKILSLLIAGMFLLGTTGISSQCFAAPKDHHRPKAEQRKDFKRPDKKKHNSFFRKKDNNKKRHSFFKKKGPDHKEINSHKKRPFIKRQEHKKNVKRFERKQKKQFKNDRKQHKQIRKDFRKHNKERNNRRPSRRR